MNICDEKDPSLVQYVTQIFNPCIDWSDPVQDGGYQVLHWQVVSVLDSPITFSQIAG